MISARMRNIIAGIVTVVWAANFISGIVVKDYQPDQAINGIFMAIVGGLFVASSKKGDPPSSGGGKDEGKSKPGAHR